MTPTGRRYNIVVHELSDGFYAYVERTHAKRYLKDHLTTCIHSEKKDVMKEAHAYIAFKNGRTNKVYYGWENKHSRHKKWGKT